MKKAHAAFTLTEAVMAIVVIGILAVVSAPFITTTLDAWMITSTDRQLIFGGRVALNRMEREIRQLKNITGTPASTALNFTDVYNQTIVYSQSGNSLMRNSDELTNLLNGTGGLVFRYYNATGGETSNVTLMRRVGIRLNLQLHNSTVSLDSLARFRNVQ